MVILENFTWYNMNILNDKQSIPQNDKYFENERPEIFELLNPDYLDILDVGCGKGRLGENLKKANPSRRVIGIEYNPDAAIEAQKVLDGVIIGDIQKISLPFEKETFDCIIFADILEHLIDPKAILIRVKPLLKQNGTIICSLPNMRHYTVILQLIMQGWEYQNDGPFDRTHIRFFSKKTIIELISSAGYKIQIIKPRISGSIKFKLINFLCMNLLKDFLAAQYIIKASK